MHRFARVVLGYHGCHAAFAIEASLHPGYLPSYALKVSSDDGKELVNEARRVFEELAKIAPKTRVAYWIALGVKDDEGAFTTEFGGEATPVAGSLPTISLAKADRLVWFLRNNDQICVEAQTARGITGSRNLSDLVQLIRDAMSRGLVERWGDDAPALDLEHHKYRVVGVKLTPEGQERVRLLEQELDPNRVWSAPVAVAR